MSTVTPYTISVPDSALAVLSQKLSTARFPDELDEAGWDYGAPLTDVKRLVSHWKESYSWRNAEKALNKLPNYQTTINVDGCDPLKIHFVHQTSKIKAAIPLLFIHGWPGSFLEVSKLLPLIESEDGPAFHLVAPSLPNFGFSEGVKKKGFELSQHAETCHKLMLALGYTEYVTQGGDLGAFISRVIAKQYPESCKAIHLNLIPTSGPKLFSNPLLAIETTIRYLTSTFSAEDKEGFQRTQTFEKKGSGYRHIQCTKPQTLGYGFADSPVAVLAWIYEKLHDWTDAYPWTDDEVLTWVSIYWFSTAGPAANVRIYYEIVNSANSFLRPAAYIPVKLGLAYFPKELIQLPKKWALSLGPVVHVSDHPSGGHFAAWERPEALVKDIKKMYGAQGGAAGVVQGRSGYE